MSEKQTSDPEVSHSTVLDLYQHCVDVFDGLSVSTTTTMGHSSTHVDLIQKLEIPPLDGKRVMIDWERPAKEDDPTSVDTDMPLEWYDETGKNHWHTPIGIKVYDEGSGAELHDYSIARATHQLGQEPKYVWAFDYHRDPSVGLYESDDVYMTELDANELIAHLESVLEN